jgi:hypothetical protein
MRRITYLPDPHTPEIPLPPFRTALHRATPADWRVLDSPRPDPDATDPRALRFHAAWCRIALHDLATIGGEPITHERVATILQCPVALIPRIFDLLRADPDGDGGGNALTERHFRLVFQSN